MRGTEWAIPMKPENSAFKSLCSVGMSLFAPLSKSHKHIISSSLFSSQKKAHVFLPLTHTQLFPLMHHWHPLQPLTCLPCHLLTPSSKPPACHPPWIIHLICPYDKASRCAGPPNVTGRENLFICLSVSHSFTSCYCLLLSLSSPLCSSIWSFLSNVTFPSSLLAFADIVIC